jgi:hypothetical protein
MERKTTTSSRPRRKVRRRRDDTWVVKEDEFHPDHRVAAAEADKLALDAALKNAKVEMARAERKLLATPAEQAHAKGLVQTVAEWNAEIARLEDAIKDKKEGDDE